MRNKFLLIFFLILLICITAISVFAVCTHENTKTVIIINDVIYENGVHYLSREERVVCTDCGEVLEWYDLPLIPCPHTEIVEVENSRNHVVIDGIVYSITEYVETCSVCGETFNTIDRETICAAEVFGQNVQHSYFPDANNPNFIRHYDFTETYYKCLEHDDFAFEETVEEVEYIVSYSDLYIKDDLVCVDKTLTCPVCGLVAYKEVLYQDMPTDTYILVGTSEYGERAEGDVIYYIGDTKKSVGMGSGQNIISHARRSGKFDDWNCLVLLKSTSDNNYYVYGCDSLTDFNGYDGNITDLIGLPFFIFNIADTAYLTDVIPIGQRTETYACQLLFKNNILYYNGKVLGLSPNFYQVYKAQFQYLTTTNSILPEFSQNYWLGTPDFSRCVFVDVDNDGLQDLMYYDTLLELDGYMLRNGMIQFYSNGVDNSIFHQSNIDRYSVTTGWLNSEYLPLLDYRNNHTTTNNLVCVRMRESESTATAVSNAVVKMYNVPELYKVDLIKHRVDFTDEESNYLPTSKDFGLAYVYTGDIRRVVPDDLLSFENSNGQIKIFVDGQLKYTVTGITWHSTGYADGYYQGRIDALLDNGDGVRAFVEGIWFGLTILFGTVLSGVAIGGYTLGNIIVSLILVAVLVFFVKFIINLL